MKTQKIVGTLPVIAVLLVGSTLLSACEFLPGMGDKPNSGPLGEWEVTVFTGSITLSSPGGEPLLCVAFSEEYFPITGDEQSYIRFIEIGQEPDFENIPSSVTDPYQFDNEGLVFVFHISFDNGYYTNDVLEGLGVQVSYASLAGGAWSMNGGVYSESELVSAEVQGFSESGTADGGYNLFTMTGHLVSDTRIEGSWEWEEFNTWSILPAACNSTGYGSGTWVAVKK